MMIRNACSTIIIITIIISLIAATDFLDKKMAGEDTYQEGGPYILATRAWPYGRTQDRTAV